MTEGVGAEPSLSIPSVRGRAGDLDVAVADGEDASAPMPLVLIVPLLVTDVAARRSRRCRFWPHRSLSMLLLVTVPLPLLAVDADGEIACRRLRAHCLPASPLVPPQWSRCR